MARTQEARSLELRAATNLARLWQTQGKKDESRSPLAPIYDWFTEVFDTQDLMDAKSLLEELSYRLMKSIIGGWRLLATG